jgi:hypothetical protein
MPSFKSVNLYPYRKSFPYIVLSSQYDNCLNQTCLYLEDIYCANSNECVSLNMTSIAYIPSNILNWELLSLRCRFCGEIWIWPQLSRISCDPNGLLSLKPSFQLFALDYQSLRIPICKTEEREVLSHIAFQEELLWKKWWSFTLDPFWTQGGLNEHWAKQKSYLHLSPTHKQGKSCDRSYTMLSKQNGWNVTRYTDS